jgi:trk system potassium uptake protein
MNIFTKRPYYTILFSFLVAITIGGILLVLPFSQRNGQWGNLINSLFMATSAIAVTGLSVYSDVGLQYTAFGQIVLMILMILGGLGIITIFSFFTIILGKKIGIMERYLLKQALNLSTMSGALKFVQRVVLIASIFIALGTMLYSIVFIPIYGVSEGIFQALFLAISAFNNAGLDILGNQSLIAFNQNALIQWVTMILIISGGLGFLVWIELFKQRFHFWKLSTYSKVVIIMSGGLIIIGMLGLILTEWRGNGLPRLDIALFTSVSSRTAGLTIVSIKDLTQASKYWLIIMMFIGANPISTGGGIKTTTAFIVGLAIWALVTGKKVHAFKRTFSITSILKAMALMVISVALIMITLVMITAIEQTNPLYLDQTLSSSAILFEIVSAFGTVGFSEGITPILLPISKVILMMIMLLGRIGPIAAISVFSDKLSWTEHSEVQYMEATVPIG